MVSQSYALYPHLTVAENIGFGLPSLMVRTDGDRRVEIEEKLLASPVVGKEVRFQ